MSEISASTTVMMSFGTGIALYFYLTIFVVFLLLFLYLIKGSNK